MRIALLLFSILSFSGIEAQRAFSYELLMLHAVGETNRSINSTMRNQIYRLGEYDFFKNEGECSIYVKPVWDLKDVITIEGMDKKMFVKGTLSVYTGLDKEQSAGWMIKDYKIECNALIDEIGEVLSKSVRQILIENGSLEAALAQFEQELLSRSCTSYVPFKEKKNVTFYQNALCVYETMIKNDACVQLASEGIESIQSMRDEYFCEKKLFEIQRKTAGSKSELQEAISDLLKIPHDVSCKDQVLETVEMIKQVKKYQINSSDLHRITVFQNQVRIR